VCTSASSSPLLAAALLLGGRRRCRAGAAGLCAASAPPPAAAAAAEAAAAGAVFGVRRAAVPPCSDRLGSETGARARRLACRACMCACPPVAPASTAHPDTLHSVMNAAARHAACGMRVDEPTRVQSCERVLQSVCISDLVVQYWE